MKKGKFILGELGEVNKREKTLSLLNRENKLSMLSEELINGNNNNNNNNNNNLNQMFYTSNNSNIELHITSSELLNKTQN